MVRVAPVKTSNFTLDYFDRSGDKVGTSEVLSDMAHNVFLESGSVVQFWRGRACPALVVPEARKFECSLAIASSEQSETS